MVANFTISFLKLIDNSSSLNEGNHDRDSVFYDFTSVFPVVLIVSEKIYQTTDSLPNAEKRGESVAEYF